MFDLIAGAVLGRLEDIADAHWDELAPYSREFLDAGRRLGAADYTRAVYEAKQVRAQLDDELEQADVVMFPTTAVVAWPHETPPATVAGRPPAEHGGITYGGLPFLALASISGHPAMSVPCGVDGARPSAVGATRRPSFRRGRAVTGRGPPPSRLPLPPPHPVTGPPRPLLLVFDTHIQV